MVLAQPVAKALNITSPTRATAAWSAFMLPNPLTKMIWVKRARPGEALVGGVQ